MIHDCIPYNTYLLFALVRMCARIFRFLLTNAEPHRVSFLYLLKSSRPMESLLLITFLIRSFQLRGLIEYCCTVFMVFISYTQEKLLKKLSCTDFIDTLYLFSFSFLVFLPIRFSSFCRFVFLA